MTVLEAYELVKAVDIDWLLDETLSAISNRVIELNTFQLDYGLNAKGGRFQSYKTQRYATKKNKMNPRPGFGNPDLKLTGAFWAALKTDIRAGVMDIYSTDHKAEFLSDRYASIYGLTEESMGVIRAEAVLIFTHKLRSEIGLQ